MRTSLILILAALGVRAFGQPGSGGLAGGVHPDTNMVFNSPRPLVAPVHVVEYRNAWGIDVLFSNNGFGMGGFYRHQYSDNLYGFTTLEISGARGSDEINLYDPYTGTILVPNGKINDLYLFPISVGVQYRVFGEEIAESFRPYVNGGVGPAVILAAPSAMDFFPGLAHAAVHVAPDLFVGIGANIGRDKRTVSGVNFRYYYIPYPKGVESVQGKPIKDFGGMYITVNWGLAY